jgi:hypothetical protein
MNQWSMMIYSGLWLPIMIYKFAVLLFGGSLKHANPRKWCESMMLHDISLFEMFEERPFIASWQWFLDNVYDDMDVLGKQHWRFNQASRLRIEETHWAVGLQTWSMLSTSKSPWISDNTCMCKAVVSLDHVRTLAPKTLRFSSCGSKVGFRISQCLDRMLRYHDRGRTLGVQHNSVLSCGFTF